MANELLSRRVAFSSKLHGMNKPTIQIEVVSDVVCPWCYIGKRRMEKAVEQLKDHYDFAIDYSPFELNPAMPASGLNQKTYLTKKFGGEDRYNQITAYVTKMAKEEGLSFDYTRQKVSPNTRDAHRIIWLAKQDGKQVAVKEAFMKAYFEDGIDLSRKENLLAIAVRASLQEKKVESLLGSDEGLFEIELLERRNHQRGVTGVPFYIINHAYGLSGAQPSDVFVKVISEIGPESILNGEASDTAGKYR